MTFFVLGVPRFDSMLQCTAAAGVGDNSMVSTPHPPHWRVQHVTSGRTLVASMNWSHTRTAIDVNMHRMTSEVEAEVGMDKAVEISSDP